MFQHLAIEQGIINSKNDTDALTPAARKMFQKALVTGRMKKFRAAVTKHERRLMRLDEVQDRIVNRHYLGTRSVAIEQIRGTMDKVDSFDIDFNPTQEYNAMRWTSVATAILSGTAMPPVELIQVGDVYYVVDGHHRVSISHALRHRYIDAEVTVWTLER
ncbi:MAG TPA: hypothetical protein VHP83_00980 [Aggregatilineaceae bacterium]|nr:hypothetical protein [Aggregatilineaceae bacterium]